MLPVSDLPDRLSGWVDIRRDVLLDHGRNAPEPVLLTNSKISIFRREYGTIRKNGCECMLTRDGGKQLKMTFQQELFVVFAH